jgi:hypothetical protein
MRPSRGGRIDRGYFLFGFFELGAADFASSIALVAHLAICPDMTADQLAAALQEVTEGRLEPR